MGNRDASMSWLNHFCDWIVLLWSYRVFHWTTVEVAWNLSTDLSLTLLFSLLINYSTSTLDSCNLVYILPYLHIYSSQWYHSYHHYSPSTSEHNSHLSQNSELVSFGLNWRSPWLNWGLELQFSVVRSFLNRNFVHSVSILLKSISSETSNWHQIYKNTPLLMILYSFMLWIMRND